MGTRVPPLLQGYVVATPELEGWVGLGPVEAFCAGGKHVRSMCVRVSETSTELFNTDPTQVYSNVSPTDETSINRIDISLFNKKSTKQLKDKLKRIIVNGLDPKPTNVYTEVSPIVSNET